VLPQQSLDRGCDPRCLAGAHAPSLERPERHLTLEVLSALPRPLQRDPGILPHAPAVEFCSEVVGLCTLTEGERTNADASCWRQDDRGLDLVEVECAMPSSRSTSSRHCFMAPGEAVELGG
jgi:hypothetical protein